VLDAHTAWFHTGFKPRYWIPIYPPMVIGGLGATVLLMRRIGRPALRTAVAGALAVVFGAAYLLPAAREVHGVRGDGAWNELRGWLANRQDITRLWTDSYSAQTLSFYVRTPFGKRLWRGRVDTFRRLSPDLPGNVGTGPLLVTHYGARNGPTSTTGWRPIWRSSDRTTLSIWIRDSGSVPRSEAAEHAVEHSSSVADPRHS
jgi:hypothetical protein